MRDPVFQRYGGARGVSRLAFRLHDMVLASDRLRPFFERFDMPRMVEHQAIFIVSILGGAPGRSDTELAALHADLEIGEAELDEMADLLVAAILEEGQPQAEADRVLQHFRRMRGRLVGALRGGTTAGA